MNIILIVIKLHLMISIIHVICQVDTQNLIQINFLNGQSCLYRHQITDKKIIPPERNSPLHQR